MAAPIIVTGSGSSQGSSWGINSGPLWVPSGAIDGDLIIARSATQGGFPSGYTAGWNILYQDGPIPGTNVYVTWFWIVYTAGLATGSVTSIGMYSSGESFLIRNWTGFGDMTTSVNTGTLTCPAITPASGSLILALGSNAAHVVRKYALSTYGNFLDPFSQDGWAFGGSPSGVEIGNSYQGTYAYSAGASTGTLSDQGGTTFWGNIAVLLEITSADLALGPRPSGGGDIASQAAVGTGGTAAGGAIRVTEVGSAAVSALNGSFAAPTVHSPALPTGLEAGDMLFLLTAVRQAGQTVTGPDGWDLVFDQLWSFGHYALFKKRVPDPAVVAQPTVSWATPFDVSMAQVVALRYLSGNVLHVGTMRELATTGSPQASAGGEGFASLSNTAVIMDISVRNDDGNSPAVFHSAKPDLSTTPVSLANVTTALGSDMAMYWSMAHIGGPASLQIFFFSIDATVGNRSSGIRLALEPLVIPQGDQDLSGGGDIASAEAVGTGTIVQSGNLLGGGDIASAEVFGVGSLAFVGVLQNLTGGGGIPIPDAGTGGMSGAIDDIPPAGSIQFLQWLKWMQDRGSGD